MARKPEPPKVHPVTAMDELKRFYETVTLLMMATHNAISFMDRAETGELDPRNVVGAINPQLKEALQKCRAWTELL